MQQNDRRLQAAGCVAFIAALILFYRFPDRLINGFLWAEDVPIFLHEAYQFGFHALGTPYQGYLHVLPRLVAYFAARTISAPHLPLVLPWVCLVISSFFAALIYLAALRLPWRNHGAAWATLVSLSFFLVPHGGEVFLTITNLQWLGAPTLLAVLYLAPHIRKTGVVGAVMAAEIFALSGPFSVLMLPFVTAVLAFKLRRPISRTTALIYAAYALGALAQGICILLLASDPTPPGALVGVLGAVTRDLLAPAFLPRTLLASTETAEMALLAIVILTLGWALWNSPVRFELFAVLLFGFIVWVAGMAKTGSGARIGWDGDSPRYTFLPYVALAWSLLIGAGTAASLNARRSSIVLCIAMLLVSSTMLVPPPPGKTTVEKLPESGYVIHLPPNWTGTIQPGKLKIRD